MRKNGEEGTQSKMAVMDWPTAGECWIDQATTALQADGSLVSGISYNRWFTDQDYREELAAVYGVPNVETALDGVPNFSNGSSFDGLSKQGNARRMNVLRRWTDLGEASVPIYLGALAAYQVEIDDLNHQLFGFGYAEVVESLG